MRFGVSDGNRKLYLRIFVSLTLCIVLTMLILSTVLYVNFESIALQQVYSSNINSLLQTSKGVSVMTDTAMTLSNQIYSDLNVAKLLYYPQPEITDIRSAVDQLTNYRLSLPFIDSVYVYNGKNDTFYINAMSNRNTGRETIQPGEAFDDPYIAGVLKDFIRYRQYIPLPRRFMINAEEGIEKSYYTYLRYDAFSGSALDSAVVVNISEEWIHGAVNDNYGGEGSDTIIINDRGLLVSNSSKYSMGADLSSKGYVARIIRNAHSPGYFIDSVDGEKSLITYTVPDSSGWIYIRTTPWKIIFAGIERMKIYTVLIGAGILIFGLLVSIFVSNKLYVPIDRIIASMRSLEEEKRENENNLRQGLLRDIILGRETGGNEAIGKKFEKLGIKLDSHRGFCVILGKIDKYDCFYRQYILEDRGALKFAVMNICTEILSPYCAVETLDMGRDGIVLILNTPRTPDGEFYLSLENLAKSAQALILNHLKISLSFTISTAGENAESLGHLYNQVAETSLHRLFYGHGCMIFSSRILEFKAKEYSYPFQKEKLMVEALMAGKTGEAKQYYNEIVADTAEFPINVFNLTISRLIFTISNTVNTIRKNNSIAGDFESGISVISVTNAETLEDIDSQFYRLFENVSRKLEERRNAKHEDLIEKIHEIINSSYASTALSIESIADSLGMSPTHMCRLYKQYTLRTILDTITEVRMKKAGELLLNTDFSIAEVSEKTGFTNSSYFYKAFKKFNGATPSDFRKNLHGRPAEGRL